MEDRPPPRPGDPAQRPRYTDILAEIGRMLDGMRDDQLLLRETIRRHVVGWEDGARHIRELEQAVNGLRAEVGDLDRRFTELLAERFRQEQPDTTTAAHLDHYEVAEKFQLFVEQELGPVAREITRRLEAGRPGEQVSRAHVLAELCRALFGDKTIDDKTVYQYCGPDDAARLVGTAGQIRDLASRPGHGAMWDFHFRAGSHVDHRYQRAWGPCDPDGFVAFPVTPAYRVGHRILVHQQVVTEVPPAGPARESGTPGDGQQ